MSNRLGAAIALAVAGALLVAACDDGDDAASLEDLEEATYRTDSLPAGEATLEDGEFRTPAAPGSATEIVILLGESAVGDLDGEEPDDAAAITIEQTGGSGTFYLIHALLSEDGELRDAGPVFLGDRIRIVSVAIEGREVVVELLDRPPDAPFAQEPTVEVTRRFALEGGALAEVGAADGTGGAAFACDASLPDAPLVIVRSPRSGDAVASGFEVEGCSRTFESNVNWRLRDRTGATIAEGFTMGGGVDAPGPFAFTVEYGAAERQVGHLEVFEEDVSGGEGFPPPRDVVPVVLSPTATQ
jgi:hypothetical protein